MIERRVVDYVIAMSRAFNQTSVVVFVIPRGFLPWQEIRAKNQAQGCTRMSSYHPWYDKTFHPLAITCHTEKLAWLKTPESLYKDVLCNLSIVLAKHDTVLTQPRSANLTVCVSGCLTVYLFHTRRGYRFISSSRTDKKQLFSLFNSQDATRGCFNQVRRLRTRFIIVGKDGYPARAGQCSGYRLKYWQIPCHIPKIRHCRATVSRQHVRRFSRVLFCWSSLISKLQVTLTNI